MDKRKRDEVLLDPPRIDIDFVLKKPIEKTIEYIKIWPLLFPLPMPFGYQLFSSEYLLFSMGKKKKTAIYMGKKKKTAIYQFLTFSSFNTKIFSV